AYGNLTVRSLLDTREQFLNESQFSDPYALVKQKENEAALLNLSERLAALNKLSWYDRQIEIIEGILAGNVFDWGAKEVVKLMMKGDLQFETARKNLQGLQLCFGQPVDVEILTLLRSEIDEVREAVQTWMLKKNQMTTLLSNIKLFIFQWK
ncbi:Pantothenate kinase 4, partial [Paramuricea clavata]